MRENSLPTNKRLQDNPLELPMQTFATWLTGEGYAQKTVQLKVHVGHNLKTLQQFLEYLRGRSVVTDRKLVPDQSAWAELLSQYEKYMRSERGLMAATISHYQY